MNLTVVFDAQGTPDDAYRTHYQQLEILFSGAGETADDLIIKVLKAHGDCSQYTVVTSDNRLAWRARRAGAKTEPVEEFLQGSISSILMLCAKWTNHFLPL